ncbi:MAG: methylenetetrahydrofolate--tRNA-(uracil(54)-C(5))-methyltransferase (FADH(2)-oxidizing) TrmFO [Clostridia bacterium]|nr:methylenetetrahydrofolate--tRNA-(uracil(54)-C(5))-methyltransferase (FADH(2)-oxidizing) TrmFO [Clostridia bacterium]
MSNQIVVNVIGAGLAGCECAYILAKNGIKVKLYEMKPKYKSEAHKSDNFAELVCSNSLKSDSITNACGLLKKEMEILDSLFVRIAKNTRVPAGQALAVDRDKFSEQITSAIKKHPNIEVIYERIDDVGAFDGIIVIATGPLTDSHLFTNIQKLVGEDSMYFYDAAAPIIEADSINMDIAYAMDRYGNAGEGDYLNLPMTKDEYMRFYNELLSAKEAPRHEFDKIVLFEGCMPIEHMAKRGEKTLVFGPLKPVGLNNSKTGEKNYAVVQLRAENEEKTMYNLVGFQTSLTFGEQARVFRMIPGLENAVFARYGVMHKNSYINGGNILDCNFRMRKNDNIYFAGQISGVEGYVESAASGMIVAYSIMNRLKKKNIVFPDTTMLGSLAKYVSTPNKNFQPMNANFGILKPLDIKIKDKKEKYQKLADIALRDISKFAEELRGEKNE